MARVKIGKVLDHLSADVQRALADAVTATNPNADIDARGLYRAFARSMERRCGVWSRVPDSSVDKE